jgi:hypothetical protein
VLVAPPVVRVVDEPPVLATPPELFVPPVVGSLDELAAPEAPAWLEDTLVWVEPPEPTLVPDLPAEDDSLVVDPELDCEHPNINNMPIVAKVGRPTGQERVSHFIVGSPGRRSSALRVHIS